jgi:hypothetical protein
MRPALLCLLALGLANCAPKAAPPAATASVAEERVPDAAFCASPQEKAALQVAALKSRLMVTALACDREDSYNSFILANRPTLLDQEKTLSSYFARHYGRRGQTEHDEYITNLANAQSRRRIIDNANFCKDGEQLFKDVAALKAHPEVVTLASGRVISQPFNIVECPAGQPQQSRPAARQSTRR